MYTFFKTPSTHFFNFISQLIGVCVGVGVCVLNSLSLRSIHTGNCSQFSNVNYLFDLNKLP